MGMFQAMKILVIPATVALNTLVHGEPGMPQLL
jgi:hypothetical protein